MAAKDFWDEFELKEELGRGAFSIVRKCVKTATNEVFAAKIFNVLKLSPRELQKLDREARICRSLKHANIVHLMGVYSDPLHQYFVFELITGGELFDDIVAREFYSEQDASHIMQQILDSICYCHSKGIIHRDVKPENLLLASKERNAAVKLADFGLAVECEGNKLDWFGFAGTPGYLSPEVIKKEPYGKLVDVWACGIILYILLVGYCPFWDDDNSKLYSLIRNSPLAFPSPEWDNVSTEAKTLILQMLEKNPANRISAAVALQNPWITNRQVVAKSLNRQQTVSVLKKFNARRKLKGAILSTILSNAFSNKNPGNSTSTMSTGSTLNTGCDTHASKDSTTSLGATKTDDVAQNPEKSPEDKPPVRDMAINIQDEIIHITDKLLHAGLSLDYGTLKEICDESMTIFDPSVSGSQLNGLNFFKFTFENSARKPAAITMMNPHVILFGDSGACISFVRLTQTVDSNMNPVSTQHEESMIWKKREEQWFLVHMHRSMNCGTSKPRNCYV